MSVDSLKVVNKESHDRKVAKSRHSINQEIPIQFLSD